MASAWLQRRVGLVEPAGVGERPGERGQQAGPGRLVESGPEARWPRARSRRRARRARPACGPRPRTRWRPRPRAVAHRARPRCGTPRRRPCIASSNWLRRVSVQPTSSRVSTRVVERSSARASTVARWASALLVGERSGGPGRRPGGRSTWPWRPSPSDAAAAKCLASSASTPRRSASWTDSRASASRRWRWAAGRRRHLRLDRVAHERVGELVGELRALDHLEEVGGHELVEAGGQLGRWEVGGVAEHPQLDPVPGDRDELGEAPGRVGEACRAGRPPPRGRCRARRRPRCVPSTIHRSPSRRTTPELEQVPPELADEEGVAAAALGHAAGDAGAGPGRAHGRSRPPSGGPRSSSSRPPRRSRVTDRPGAGRPACRRAVR